MAYSGPVSGRSPSVCPAPVRPRRWRDRSLLSRLRSIGLGLGTLALVSACGGELGRGIGSNPSTDTRNPSLESDSAGNPAQDTAAIAPETLDIPSAEALSVQDPDMAKVLELGLLKGQMLVSEDLLENGQGEQAQALLGDSIGQVQAVAEDLNLDLDVDWEQLKSTATGLQSTFDQVTGWFQDSGQEVEQLQAQIEASLVEVEAALDSLPVEKLESLDFVVPVLQTLLEEAKIAYGEALANGLDADSYQAVQGMVRYTQDLYDRIAPQVASQDPALDEAVRSGLAQLVANLPLLAPPSTTEAESAESSESVTRADTVSSASELPTEEELAQYITDLQQQLEIVTQ